MKKKLKYIIPAAIFLLIVGTLIYGSIVDKRISNYKPGITYYDDLTTFEKIVCKINGHKFETRAEVEARQKEREKEAEKKQTKEDEETKINTSEEITYVDAIKEYDRYANREMEYDAVIIEGTVSSIDKLKYESKSGANCLLSIKDGGKVKMFYMDDYEELKSTKDKKVKIKGFVNSTYKDEGMIPINVITLEVEK